MGDYRFIVTIFVDGWVDPGDGRTESDYAKAALNAADLRETKRLEGFADLDADADIDDVEELLWTGG